ncbi:MAG: membrane protein [Rhodospirillaceae bacterium BRH_c57]|nr:MAG: membrane protein [Rhodospirillaceae bacterium BRH_c57]
MNSTRSFKMAAVGLGLAAMTTLGACESIQGAPKATAGTVLGGIGGAVIGSQFGGGSGQIAATAAGTLLGAFVGSEIGKSLDRADRDAISTAQQQAYAAPVGQTIAWNNPDSGNRGTITPVRDGYAQSGSYCREYRTTVTIDGRREEALGTACQQPDGTWRVVN